MIGTLGLNHLGLTVKDLDQTTAFFTEALNWTEVAPRDESYPRSTVSDGHLRLTLWQADQSNPITDFDRRANVGLHHLALEVASEEILNKAAERLADWPGVTIEFIPEALGQSPRKHMMLTEPGGIRIELIWAGASHP